MQLFVEQTFQYAQEYNNEFVIQLYKFAISSLFNLIKDVSLLTLVGPNSTMNEAFRGTYF